MVSLDFSLVPKWATYESGFQCPSSIDLKCPFCKSEDVNFTLDIDYYFDKEKNTIASKSQCPVCKCYLYFFIINVIIKNIKKCIGIICFPVNQISNNGIYQLPKDEILKYSLDSSYVSIWTDIENRSYPSAVHARCPNKKCDRNVTFKIRLGSYDKICNTRIGDSICPRCECEVLFWCIHPNKAGNHGFGGLVMFGLEEKIETEDLATDNSVSIVSFDQMKSERSNITEGDIFMENSNQKKLRIFIGSSVEGKPVADAIQYNLDYDFECKVWTQNVFMPSESSLGSLLRAKEDYDCAVIVLTPDDTVKSRDELKSVARDNTIFELGLFMGAFGNRKTFMVIPRSSNLNLPTDLLGITALTYEAKRSDDDLIGALGIVCTQIKIALKKL